MKSPHLTKAFTIAAACSAAAIITGTAALLDGLFPRGSRFAFLFGIAPLAIVVPLAVAGFVVACDQFDAWLERRSEDRWGKSGDSPRESTARLPQQATRGVDRPVFASRLCFPNSALDPSALLPLRARANRTPVRPAAATKQWIGQ